MKEMAHSGVDDACWQVWFDGSAFPNPGKLGLGVLVRAPDGRVHTMFSQCAAGTGCNNEAEMLALCAALSLAHAAGARRLLVYGDSDFAVRHGAGVSHTTAVRLVALVNEAQSLMRRFDDFELRWIPRHRNGEADRLSRAALGLVDKPAPHPGKRTQSRKRWRRG